jgi:hypothetical protein
VTTLPSLNVPVAVNFKEVPAAICVLAGTTVMLANLTLETVNPVEPLTEPKAAEILLVPAATLVTSPLLLIVAAVAVDELQSTDVVMSCVLLSLKVPVAVNCLVAPMGMVELTGETATETTVALVTVTPAVPLIPAELAVTVALPTATPVASPDASTLSKLCGDEDHVTEGSSWVLPSSKMPVALNWAVVPVAIVAVAGVTVTDSRCAFTTVKSEESVNPPAVAVIIVVPAPTVVANPVPAFIVPTPGDDELQITPVCRSALVPSV